MPVKFDDIPKGVTEVLNDDFPVSGHVLKTKQKTSMANSVFSTQVNFYDKECATPAKLTLKVPAPLGCTGVSIDKLEMDKAGKFKLEASSNKICPVAKFEVKSDLKVPENVAVALTYTGLKDLMAKFETKALKPADFAAEATYECPAAICGVKYCAGMAMPELGVRFAQGPVFAALMAKEKFGTFSASCCFTQKLEAGAMKYAATCTYGGKASGSFALGVSCKGLYKLKVDNSQSVFCSIKHKCSKGVTALMGARYNIKKGDYGYGVELSIE